MTDPIVSLRAPTIAPPPRDFESKNGPPSNEGGNADAATEGEAAGAAADALVPSLGSMVDWLEQYEICMKGASQILDLYVLATQCHVVSLAVSELMEQPR